MSKIFNKNTVKLSYSCRRNINSKISSNNRRIDPPPTNYDCNCRNKSDCPLDNKCLTPSIVYKGIGSVTNKPDKEVLQNI